MLATWLNQSHDGTSDEEQVMGRAIIRMLSVMSLAVAVLAATTLSSGAVDRRCTATSATYNVQMGPGGDFAGATVIEPASAKAPAADGIVMGPGYEGDSGGFISKTASEADDSAESAPLATDGSQSACD